MKQNVYLVMNYWPSHNYWLCSEMKDRGIKYRLIGIDNDIRKLRYAYLFGGIIWKLLRFLRAAKIAIGVKGNEVIIVQDDTASSVFIACFLRLLSKPNNIISLNMMDSLKSNFIKQGLYKCAFKNMFASTNNKNLSDLYCSLYRLPQDKFFFLPDCISNWGMNILKSNVKCHDAGYIFSGGSTFRDWNLFIDVARRLPQYKFIGIARKSKFPHQNLPDNIEMCFDVDESVFNDFLKKSSVVFLPINVKTQGGQIVMFTAGLYHKPIITTNTAAIKTYIENGKNGLLCEFKDTESAVRSVKLIMEDNSLRERLGNKLYDDIRKLTPSHFIDMLIVFLKSKNIYL